MLGLLAHTSSILCTKCNSKTCIYFSTIGVFWGTGSGAVVFRSSARVFVLFLLDSV